MTLDARDAGVLRVRIHGEVDLTRYEELDGVLASAEAQSSKVLEVDLSRVTFMDSQGLRLLLRARDRMAGNNNRLVIVGAGPFIQRLFRVSGLADAFQLDNGPAPTHDDAST